MSRETAYRPASPSRPARAEIRLGALQPKDPARARDLAGPGVAALGAGQREAKAYGHGMIRVASELLAEGADYLGVALIEEALALRDAGLTAPILVFGSPPDESVRLYARGGIDLAIASAAKAPAAYAAAELEGRNIPGPSEDRHGHGEGSEPDGTSSTALPRSCRTFGLAAAGQASISVGAFSHFATADCDLRLRPGAVGPVPFIARFSCETRDRPLHRPHRGTSAALVGMPESRFGMVSAAAAKAAQTMKIGSLGIEFPLATLSASSFKASSFRNSSSPCRRGSSLRLQI